MKKILLVSGDSWTDPNFISAEHPELDCSWPKWPEILAKKLNMECVNLGRNGAGNEYIYSSILDQLQIIDHTQIGYVVAGWSGVNRRSYAFSKPTQWRTEKVDNKGDLRYWLQRSIRYYYSFQTVMNYLKLPYIHMQMVNMYRGYLHQRIFNPPQATNKFLKKLALNEILSTSYKFNDKFLGWPTDKDLGGFSIDVDIIQDQYGVDLDIIKNDLIISKLDLHPNKKGQEKIAEYIHENI